MTLRLDETDLERLDAVQAALRAEAAEGIGVTRSDASRACILAGLTGAGTPGSKIARKGQREGPKK